MKQKPGNDSRIQKHIKSFLLSPLVVGSILLMLVNDHFLKGSGILPAVLTGKLSDVGFLLFFPTVVAFILRVNTRRGLFLAHLGVALFYTGLNVSTWFSDFMVDFAGFLGMEKRLWPDLTDLLILPVLGLSWHCLLKRPFESINGASISERYQSMMRNRIMPLVVAITASATCLATSADCCYDYGTPYDPLYMSWADFRSSVEVLPPQEPRAARQVLVHGNYFFVNEPDVGIHVYDNTVPTAPVPLAFLKILGNRNLNIYSNHLYADSFVDIVIFSVADMNNITLVNRLEDAFPYNPYYIPLPQSNDWYPYATSTDKTPGVIIGWQRVTYD